MTAINVRMNLKCHIVLNRNDGSANLLELKFFFVENAFILEKIEFFMFDKEFGDKI